MIIWCIKYIAAFSELELTTRFYGWIFLYFRAFWWHALFATAVFVKHEKCFFRLNVFAEYKRSSIYSDNENIYLKY
jgi:hypothetical protein